MTKKRVLLQKRIQIQIPQSNNSNNNNNNNKKIIHMFTFNFHHINKIRKRNHSPKLHHRRKNYQHSPKKKSKMTRQPRQASRKATSLKKNGRSLSMSPTKYRPKSLSMKPKRTSLSFLC